MKNTPQTGNPIDKIYEVVTSETRKFEIRRKLSATNEKRQEGSENSNMAVDNLKEKGSIKPN